MTARTTTLRRFRGSRFDNHLGNTIAVAGVSIPPFAFGWWGLIYAMFVVNLLLTLSLFRTPDRFDEMRQSTNHHRRTP